MPECPLRYSVHTQSLAHHNTYHPTSVPTITTATMFLSRLSMCSLRSRTLILPPPVQSRPASNILIDQAGLVRWVNSKYSHKHHIPLFFRPPPPLHTQYGLLKAVLNTCFGIYVGAFISQKMAAFLEENELFVPEDDEDEDDWGGDCGDEDCSQYLLIFFHLPFWIYFKIVEYWIHNVLLLLLKYISNLNI